MYAIPYAEILSGNIVGLGVVSALIAIWGGVGPTLLAQTPSSPVPSAVARLTVRPHEMATATRTERTGEFSLDSLTGYFVYVPQQCVGTRRCPLVVVLHGAGYDAKVMLKWERPVADKQGMIILAPTSITPLGLWVVTDEPSSYDSIRLDERDLRNIDAAMKQVLRKYAIDPDKIALVGRCAGGAPTVIWGGYNLDVFSRIVVISGAGAVAKADPRNTTTEFIIDAGYGESMESFLLAQRLRRAGHPVKQTLSIRGHEHQAEDYMFMGQLLTESWAIPDPKARRAPVVVVDPVPLLTVEALTQMTTFWQRFLREPDSIRATARRDYLREVVVPVGDQPWPSILMVDMPALAAKYLSVAADLKVAGLTAQQHDAYRVALLGAAVIEDFRSNNIKDPTSAVGKNVVVEQNVEFMQAHNELKPKPWLASPSSSLWLSFP